MSDSVNANKYSLLIEELSIPMINNANAFISMLICKAKNYHPVVLVDNPSYDNEYYKQYFGKYDEYDLDNQRIPIFLKCFIIFQTYLMYLLLRLGKPILSLSYAGVKYGDLIYDQYLVDNEVATIRTIDLKILTTIKQCLTRHYIVLLALRRSNAKGVLVSHQVGIKMGVMLRVALRYGYDAYLRAGNHESTLQKFTNLSEVYDYEYKPSQSDLSKLLKLLGNDLNREYQKVLERQVSGLGDKSGIDAYSSSNHYFKSKKEFNSYFQLDKRKANVFVMLHALNDHPHSHFGKMLFKDYYDWMLKTLEIARQNTNVNWIFKQHPSIKYYSTKDISYPAIFSNIPSHIRYIDEHDQIDTRSLVHCADMVVTCAGSAGFEMPAMAGIPSITAGKNHYYGLGIAYEPKSIEEYTEYLLKLKKPKKLSKGVINRAKAAYIYIYDTSRVPVSVCPRATLAEEKSLNQRQWYGQKVAASRKKFAKQIEHETSLYTQLISKSNFRRLTKLDLST